jgi:hypothetical protein
MKTCLAVIAHDGAGDTINDFMPRWRKMGFPIIAYMPHWQLWPSKQMPDCIMNIGYGGHDAELMDRFFQVCCDLLQTGYDAFLIFEYDTVNLIDTFPEGLIRRDSIGSSLLTVFGEGAPAGYMTSFSPWIMTRPMLAAFIEAMRCSMRNPVHTEWHSNLLDRWLATVLIENKLPFYCVHSMPYPFEALEPINWIKKDKVWFAHGYKRREDFKDAWPA